MLRAVLDSNVCISGLIYRGVPGAIVDAATRKQFLPITSDSLLEEIGEKLSGKLKRAPEEVRHLLNLLGEISDLTSRRNSLNSSLDVCRDPKDNHVLECALAGQADVIVSGDKDLLVLHPFRDIRILTPRQFLDELQSTSAAEPLP